MTFRYFSGDLWDRTRQAEHFAEFPVRSEENHPTFSESPDQTRRRFDDYLDRFEEFKRHISAGTDAACPLQGEGLYFDSQRASRVTNLMEHFEDRAPTVRARAVAFRTGRGKPSDVYARFQTRTVYNESQLGRYATMAFLLRMSYENAHTPWRPTVDDERFRSSLTADSYQSARDEAHFLWRWITGYEPPPDYLGPLGTVQWRPKEPA